MYFLKKKTKKQPSQSDTLMLLSTKEKNDTSKFI